MSADYDFKMKYTGLMYYYMERFPDLPVVFLNEIKTPTDTPPYFADDVSVALSEYLDTEGPFPNVTYVDLDDLAEDIRLGLAENNDDIEDVEKKTQQKLEEYAPHWRPCILVSIGWRA